MKNSKKSRSLRKTRKAAKQAELQEMLYERLEDRVLFDAVPDATLDPNAEDVSNMDQANAERFDTSVYAEDVKTVSDARLFSQEDTATAEQVRHELVIVDTSVDDYQQLVDDILGEDDPTRDIEVVTIDGELDGIEQISEVLSRFSGLDALHIVSHGDESGVNLGDIWLTRDNLGGYAVEIAQWGNALSSTGDILFLGCDLAATAEGQDLLQSISTLTGADVAASVDDTGYAARGGDWDLEYVIGSMETSIAFSESVQEDWQHLLAPGPQVTLNVPGSAYIGDTVNFTATFDNTGTNTGYGPFIDLIFPVNGADGAAGTDTPDGLDFVGASYLGSALTTIELVFPDDDGAGAGTTGTVDHPYAVDSAGDPLQVTGTAGDKLIVIQLPFGSFVPGQPSVTVDVQAQLSNLADPYDLASPETELDIRARAGFQFGADAADNPASDPSIVSDIQTDSSNWAINGQIQPTLLDMDKVYSGPENETATGPNYVRSYTIRAFLAQGQTLNDLTFTDFLPNTMQYVPGSLVVTNGASTLTAADYTIIDEPVTPGAQNPSDNDLVVRIDQAVLGAGPGTAAATITFDYFIPLNDADGTPVNDPSNGDDHFVDNDASITGQWLPTDTRDQPALTVSSDATTQDHRLEQQSIAIQKGVQLIEQAGTAGVTPGDALQYTLNFQVSDFFAFNDVIITDTFSDGQDWYSDSPTDSAEVMIPTLELTEHGVTVAVAAFSSSNYTVTENADGTTTVVFDVSQELIDRASGDATAGELLGGWIAQGGTGIGQPDGSFDAGATTGRIVFRTEVLEDYKDPGSADQSVDQGDTLTNGVAIDGALLNVNDLTVRGTREADDSGASVTIATGVLTKYIYAINGYTNWQPVFDPDGDGTPQVESGDLITYRIEYTLPTSDVEGFELEDYLPLPVFDSTGLNDTRGNTSTFAPGENQWHLHPDDTFTEFFEANATAGESFGGDPEVNIVSDAGTNSFSIQYGTVDDPNSLGRKIDILVTVPIEAVPTADGLFYTNQAQTIENNTFGGSTVNQVISMQDVLVYNPDLNITKGAVSTSSGNGNFTPGAVGPTGVTWNAPGSSSPAFTGQIDSDGIAANPIDSNVTDLDGGDLVKFAITIENTGNADAYDITIADLLPPGFVIPSNTTGLNLQIIDGNGSVLTYTGNDTDLFGGGITINDPIQVFLSSDATNELTVMRSRDNFDPATNEEVVGDHNVANIEALARDPFTHTLYAANANTLGTINLTTGAYTQIGTGFGTASGTVGGSATNVNLTDVDGMAFNQQTGELYGVHDNGSYNVIFKIDTATGGFVPGAFGGDDFVELNIAARLDDIAITRDGQIYGTDATSLYEIGIDEATATGTLTLVGAHGGTITDLEGLSVDQDGRMWGSTGNSGNAADNNRLFEIDPSTGLAFNGRQLDDGGDYEASESYAPGSTGAIDDYGNAQTLGDGSNIIIITYDLELAAAVEPDTLHTNNATLTNYSSQDGGVDYSDGTEQDSATATITNVAASKSVVETSESHTSGTDVAIGEIVRYRLQVQIPEGTSPNLQLLDYLPGGMTFLNDNSARVALVSNAGGMTSSTLSGAGLNISGDESNINSITPTFVLPDGAISTSATANSDTYGNGTDVYFKLGDIVTTENDDNAEYVIVEFNAIVNNDQGGTTNDAGENRNNRFDVRVDGTVEATSANVGVRVHEPSITNLLKDADLASGDAGDVVTFTITYSNANGGNNAAAFDSRLLDTLPADYTLNVGSVNVTLGGGSTGVINNSTGNTVDVTIDEVPLGGTVQVTYTATLNTSVEPGSMATNTASLTYTSLPGANGTTSNPTGSSTPGTAGSGLGERDGSGAPNDYTDVSSADVTITSPTILKRLVSTDIVTTGNGNADIVVGEFATYEITLTLPEGTTNLAAIVDTLDAGLAFVDMHPTIPPVLSPGLALSAGGSTTPSISSAGGTITWDLGTITNSDTNNASTETITLTYRVVALNEIGNQDGGTRDNLAEFDWEHAPATPPSDDAEDVTIIEPELTVTKTVALDTDGDTSYDDGKLGDAGDGVQYTITLTNASGVDAFDIDFTDVLPTVGGGSSAILGATLASVSDTATSGAVGAGDFEVVGSDATGYTLRRVAASNIDLLESQVDAGSNPRVITLVVQGTVASSVAPNQSVDNTAFTTWSSLDGDVSTPLSTHNANSVERTGADGEGVANLNNYEDSATDTFTINPPVFTKHLFATDQTETSGNDVTIGETVTYALVVSLPEGVSPDATIVDQLPPGLDYTNFQIVTTAAGSFDYLGNPLLFGDFNGTIQAGSPSVSGGVNDGDDVTFTFGQIDVAVDNDPTNNAFLILVDAVVSDVATNTGYVGIQQSLVNTATIDFAFDSEPPQSSNPVNTTVVEPSLSITKEFGPTVNVDEADSGDTVTINLTVDNTAGTSSAYDVVIQDILSAANYDLTTVNLGSSGSQYPTDFTATFTSGTGLLQYSGGTIAAGATVTFSFTVELAETATPGVTITNTATITDATTLDGVEGGERNTPDPEGDGSDSDDDTVRIRRNSLAGNVWDDANNDGVFDGSESGIGGVDIRLQGTDHHGNAVDITIQTLADGSYLFDNLRPGNYSITQDPNGNTIPAIYLDGQDSIGTQNGNDAVNDLFFNINLPTGTETHGTANNFGEIQAAALSGAVYHDADNDGVFDGTETGINGVQIRLTGTNDLDQNVDVTVTTAGGGLYSFTGLRPSNAAGYTITEVAEPAGYIDGRDTDGSLANGDSTTVNNEISSINVVPGDTGVSYNFGELVASTLSGYVYHDSDNDGDRTDEPVGAGIQNSRITLTGTDDLGNSVNQFIDTDVNGYWEFTNLRPSDATGYTITQTTVPAEYIDGMDTIGTPGGNDAVNDVYSSVVVTSNTTGSENNFGELLPASLAGTVFNDHDNDGTFEPGDGETGIEGVAIRLTGTDDLGNTVDITINTDANGDYAFSNMRPSNAAGYTLTETHPTAYTDGIDSDGSLANGDTTTNDVISSINVSSGDAGADYDFGERGTSISGTVFVDDNRDGDLDGGEAVRVGGVTIELFDMSSGSPVLVDTVVTGVDGTYSFDHLPAGDYRIVQTQPTQYGNTSPNTINLTLPLTGSTNNNFGESLFDIGDTIYFDANNNGTQDIDEEGLANVDVTLQHAGLDGIFGNGDDPAPVTVTTDANGDYSFTELFNGNYTVTVDQADLPAGMTGTQETDDTAAAVDGISNIAINNADRFDVDFGYTGALSIGDTFWYDVDGDGTRSLIDSDGDGSPDTLEPGLAGVTVNLTFAGADGNFTTADDNLTLSTTTLADGTYNFGNLPEGEYQVSYVVAGIPTGLTATVETDDSAAAIDGTSNILLTASRTDVDFGFAGDHQLGDIVWFDYDGDGTRNQYDSDGDTVADTDEPIFAGVEVTIVWAGFDGNLATTADNVVFTDTTDASGVYGVSGLADGTYQISVDLADLPSAMTQTFEVDATTNNSADVTIAGNDRLDVDFGFNDNASISNQLWHDVNGDGVFNQYDSDSDSSPDTNEPGLAGVTITAVFGGADGIIGNADDFTLTTVTAADGTYSFDNLPQGNYEVTVNTADLPTGFTNTFDKDDFNATAGDSIANVALGDAENDTGVDFGYAGNYTVGDTIWFDRDGDGVQDNLNTPTGEPGLGGVLVTLTYAGPDGMFATTGDNVVLTTTTDATGAYSFGNLLDGDYQVAVGAATLPNGTTQTFETDGTVLGDLNNRADFSIAGSNRSDIDFGYTGALSIGDRVWYDADADGNQDAGEPGMVGVDVVLTFAGADGVFGNADDFTIRDTTDLNGLYGFDNLPSGEYRLAIDNGTLPLEMTNATAETDDSAATIDGTSNISLSANRTDVDFGFAGNRTVGDYIWFDRDGDGTRNQYDSDGDAVLDTFEPGYGNVGVTLLFAGQDGVFGNLDDTTLNTTTAADGSYSFTNIPDGDFRVSVDTGDIPAGTTQTFDQDDAAFGASSLDDTGNIRVVGADRLDVDFGYNGNGAISDFVWMDVDNDGIQDAGEPGLAGISVDLLFFGDDGVQGTADDFTLSTFTDASGNYAFTNLPAGQFEVTVNTADPDMPSGLVPVAGTESISGTASVFLGVGQTNDAIDFGFAGTHSLGDTVFFDYDGNGTQNQYDSDGDSVPDTLEPGIGDVTVTLVSAGQDGVFGNADDFTRQTTTDADGNYGFGNLADLNYRVVVTAGDLPTGTVQTADQDDAVFGAGSLDHTSRIRINGGDRLDADFGYRGQRTLGDRLWHDTNADGVQDGGEPGVAGVTITGLFAGENGIFGDADDIVLTTITDASGSYSFGNLPEGEYQISYNAGDLPSGMTVNTFDVDGTTDGTANVTLGATDRDDVDFGFTGTLSIGDRLWFDGDADGVQDATNEPGLVGVDVTLIFAGPDGVFGNGDDATLTTTTGADGAYQFDNLPDGDYRVSYDAADLPGAATDPLTPTFEVDGTPNNQADVTLSGTSIDTVDFGFSGNGSISDFVWIDVDGDGIQDAGEPGLANIDVLLTFAGANGTFGDADDFTLTVATDPSGLYSFDNLPDGNYQVAVDTADTDMPGSLVGVSGPQSNSGTVARTLDAAQRVYTDVDFGFAGTNTVGNFVWFDSDSDGNQDAGEPGLGLVDVTLAFAGQDGIFGNADDIQIATTTDANGGYSFTQLPDGDYRVAIDTADLPTGVTQTFERNDGANTLPHTAEFVVNAGDRTDIDFGYTGLLNLGDTVWYDVNGNATQEAGEPGLNAIDIDLTFAGANGVFGDADDFTLQVTTDPNGAYNFANLPQGEFRVAVDGTDLPSGMNVITAETDDSAVALDGTSNITLTADRTDVDFGFRGARTLGDRVWFDGNGDGVQDAVNEPGLGDVRVNLLFAGQDGLFGNADDVTIQTITDANGNYNFTDLPNGDFQISVEAGDLPAGMTQTFEVDGSTNNQAEVSIAGSDIDTVDFGFRGAGAISDRVWHDVNGDGIQDAGEPGLVGLTVNLDFAGEDGVFGTADDFSLTTVTVANGVYGFDNLPAGEYRVDVDEATVPGSHNQTFERDDVVNNIAGVAEVSLTNGQIRTDVDFGYEGTLSLGDRVWFDANDDGVQDAGEPGLEGVGVTLIFAGPDGNFATSADNVTLNTTTGANGAYQFDRLFDGNYQLVVTTADLPGGAIQTHDQDDAAFGAPTLDHAANVALNGANRDDADFGYRGNSSIGDLIFFDVNNDGTLDAGDRGLPNIDVTAEVDINGDGNPDYTTTVTTDINGAYLFENLIPGTYTVTVDDTDLPPGMAANQTVDPDGTLDHTTDVVLGANEDNDTIDFGYNSNGTIGDRVWLDTNGDGVQDVVNEPGLANVDVTLTWAGPDGTFGNADDEVFTTTTDDDGNYLFEFLAGGEYIIDVDQADAPGNTSLTTGNDGIQITLPVGGSNDTIDFGFVGGAAGGLGAGEIGDRVFYDFNGDGIENGDDVGYAGVDVTITADIDGDGVAEVFTATTNSTGFYQVPGLPFGDYTVTLTPPNGTNATFDSDGHVTTPNTSDVTLNAANPGSNIQDFGLTGTGTVGDTIFFDEDGDGVQDLGEVGIPGVTVTIDVDLDGDGNPDFTTNAVTDQDGNYTFPNIPEGQVTVSVATPTGSNPTTDHDETAGGDSDSTINLTAGETNNDQDFGFLGTGSIGDVVFFDADGDGTQDDGTGADPSEPGLAGVTVELDIDFNGDGTVDHTVSTVTDANGGYSFDNLPAGDYTVRVTQPAGTTQTFDANGGLDNQSFIALGDGENNTTHDFGYRGNSVLGDTIFWDVNNDGTQDAGDFGLPGVDVTIEVDVNGDGTPDYTHTVTTDVDGNYQFDNLIPGDYTVTVDPNTVPGDMGNNPTFNPDAVIDNTTEVTVGVDETIDSIDFGYTGTATLGDRVWLDTNGDGVQDPTNEPGLANVDVQITWAGANGIFGDADDEVLTTTTDNDGNYDFANLPSGDFRVDLLNGTAPLTTSVTTSNDTHDVNLTAGDDHNDSDFGLVGTGSIGDHVFFDHNGDGIENGDDVGYPGVTITVESDIDGDGINETFTVVTGSNGDYNLPGLPEGTYTVTLTPPNGTSPSFDSDGIATPNSSIVTLDTANPSSDTQDFGLTGTGTIGDTIFFDEDGDGVQGPGEVGIPGVTVTIDVDLDGDGNPDFTTNAVTDQDGNYTFPNIPEGQVTVSVATPTGSNPTTDHDGTAGGDSDSTINLTAGETNNDQDFGFLGTGSIGDVVFFDADGDGTQDDGTGADPSEPGLSGVTVELDIDFNGDGTIDHTVSTVTDANGGYSFDNLPAGDYTVRVSQPAGTTQTFDANGGLDNQSSIALGDGENNTTHDFGYRGNGSIGDVILFDVNNDGLQDANDRGLSGIDVTIAVDVNGDGTPDYTHTVTTDIDGNYSFDNLIPGDYTITVDTTTLPAGMENFPTIDPDGTATPHTADVTLGVDETNNDQDFAYYADSGVGDVVWLDLNGDGVLDAGEPGIGNVDVRLTWYGPNGVPDVPGPGSDDEVFTQTTNSSGGYFFPGRPEGQYRVEVLTATLPPGLTLTTGNNPDDFFLPISTSDLDRDFGFVGAGSIGDQVFFDLNGDGSFDTVNETGYPGVTVTITGDFDNDGIVESFETVTNPDGTYNISGLPLGDWTVTLTPPSGTASTFDADGHVTTPNTSDVTLTAGTPAADNQDFGLTGTGQVVGDTIFYDIDGNGVQGPGEPGIPGVTVQIDIDLDGDGTPDISTTVQTDQNGDYVFPNIPAGTHTISVVPPGGSNPTSDVDGDTVADTSGVATVPPGGTGGPGDMGFLGTGSIGNTVFFDADGDGVQGAGEPGLPNVPVALEVDFNGDGIVDHVINTTTDNDGNYNFGNLPVGSYTVVVAQPAGTNPTSDADGEVATPNESSLNLGAGEDNVLQDFGYTGTGSITDTVFFDIDNDGTDDTGSTDRPLENVDVTLAIDLDGDGTPDYSTTVPTDGNGDFTFANLIPGTYTITTDPSDMPPGLANNPTVDNDGTDTPHSADYVLPPGGNADGPGFGFHATPDYQITKTSNATSVQPGDTIQYTIRVRNNGELDGRNVTITDNFPADILSISDASGGVVDNTNGVITWDLAAMQPGEEVILLVTAEVFDPAGAGNTDITNTVTVSDDGYNGADPDTTDNTSSVTTPFDATPDYVVTVTDDLDEADPGDSVTYTIVVTNEGNQDGTGVVVTSQLKPELMANVTPNAGGVYDPATGIVTWNLGNLDAGETVILTIDADIVNPLPFGYDQTCNTVSASDDGTNGPDPTPGNNSAMDTTQLPVFAFDSFTDFSGGGKDLDTFNRVDVLPTSDDPYKNRLSPLPVDTVYTGIVDPGTTLSGKIYDEHGRLVGEQIVVADAAGNWLMQFPTVVLYEQPHEMRIDQTLAVHNSGMNAGFNMRRFFHPAIHSQLYMNEPISVGAAFRHDPFSVLNAMHEANNNPLGFDWKHHAYELIVSSSNTSAM